MPVTRMRMRPWLEKMIDSSTVSGLRWLNEDHTLFSIPWKHAARHGWELDKDACLFKKWAIHTGKYVEGQTCDPKTWKANFRCAMNSLPDIEEVKDQSINKGHQAVRVFRMLPVVCKSRDKRSKAKEIKRRRKVKQEEDSDYSDSQSPASTSEVEESTQESTVDSTVLADLPQGHHEVPDLNDLGQSVEIGSSVFSDDYTHRFQVSPEHSSYDYTDDIIRICQQLERDASMSLSSFDTMAILSNEASSPDSTWSDSSSDFDELPQYTTLGSDPFRENMWGELFPSTSFD